MAHSVVENCPLTFKDWSSRASLKCSNGNIYHCVKDEFSRIVEVCTTPLWIQRGHCPIYNTGLKKIDSTECADPSCPSEVYRSDAVYKYNCYQQFSTRITTENMRTTIPVTTALNVATIVGPVITVFVVALLVFGIIMWRKRRQCGFNRAKNGRRDKHGAGEDENLMESTCEDSSSDNHQITDPAFQKTYNYLKNDVFTSSKFYEQAVGALYVHHCITIVGPPGSGKTLTAVQLAYRKCGSSEKSQLYYCQTLEETLNIAEKDSNAYIIVDDWLDKYLYYQSKLRPAIDHLNAFYKDIIEGKKINLILTVEEDKWSRLKDSFKDCRLLNPPYLLTINSNTFSETERQNIVRRHFQHFNIEESCVNGNVSIEAKKTVDIKGQLIIPSKQAEDGAKGETDQLGTEKTISNLASKIKDEKAFSFPVVVDLICNNNRLMKALDHVLHDGFTNILTKFLETWSKDYDIMEKRSFCILVFAALLGREISPRDFSAHRTGPMYNRICSMYACQLNANNSVQKGTESKVESNQNEYIELQSDEELLKTNLRLKSCLYRISKGHNDSCFVFQHSSLLRFVLLYIKKTKGESFIIENAAIEVLLNNCWLDKGKLDKILPGKKNIPEGKVIVSTSFFKPLAERIFSEIPNGYCIPEWDKHIFFSHEKFLDAWNNINNVKSHGCSVTECASNSEKS